MTSVVIAAHNEAGVLGRCLDWLLADAAPDEFEVVVVANGCTDATAEVAAARPSVRVVNLPVAGKVAALNAGDEQVHRYPRIYLDADIVLPSVGVRALGAALAASAAAGGPVLAATTRREVDVSRSPALVRSYYAINSRLPAFEAALFGRGVVALSAAGRARFGSFPDVVADDLFLDSLFTAAEKLQVESVSSRVSAPRTTRDLLRRLVRVRRGNASLRAVTVAGPTTASVRKPDRRSWLRDVVRADAGLIPAAACYAAITVAAAMIAKLPQRSASRWGTDTSSRVPDAPLQTGGPR